MKFTQIPSTAFKEMQLNAGILLDTFTPSSGTIGNILGATSGGINFVATPEYTDFGDDVDNCPKNTMELKRLDSWTVTMSGTFATVTADLAEMLVGAGDNSTGHIVPRSDVATTDFKDIWWVGDYSDKNGATNGGYCAIHMMNALSTGGFQIQSSDKAKGQFAFEFTGHYSIEDQTEVPFEIYIKSGTTE